MLPTNVTLRVKPEKNNHPRGGARERRGISVGAADYDEDNSCAELADRDMEMLEFVMSYPANKLREFVDPAPIWPPGLVARPGKDACGFCPGQLGRVHQAHVSKGAPGPFNKLQPVPVNYEAETPFQPDVDNSTLRKYVHFQKIVRKPTSDWYNQISYKAAFDLPYFNTGHENKCTPTTDPGPHIIWASTGQSMFFYFPGLNLTGRMKEKSQLNLEEGKGA